MAEKRVITVKPNLPMAYLYNLVDGFGKRKIDQTYKDTWESRETALGENEYKDYLKSKQWANIKEKALKREYYQSCFKCGAKEGIELHHRSYKWIRTKYAMQGLIPLCRGCHQAVHDYAKTNGVSVRIATNKVCGNRYVAPPKPKKQKVFKANGTELTNYDLKKKHLKSKWKKSHQ